MSRLWTPNRPSFYMSPYGALVGACRPKGQQAAAFSPTDIAGLQLWLKADAGLYQDAAMTTPAVADADPVGGWADQSLNSNHATQATAGSRPILKLAIQNGRPVVRFDGTNDSLQVAFITVGPFTVFIVFAATTNGLVYEHGPGGTLVPGAYLYTTTGATISVCRAGLASNKNLSASWGSDGAYRVVVHMHNGTHITHALYINSSATVLSDSVVNDVGSGSLTDAFNIASRNQISAFVACDIAEFIVYNSALSTANRQAVEAYLNSRWAVY